MTQYITSYAQNREDIIIDAFFEGKLKGVYVDVGANHPIVDSVTKFFSLKGWTGVNIEPNPSLARQLKTDRPHDTVVVKGVSNKKGKETFRMYGNTGLSTFSKSIKNETGTVYDVFKQDYQDSEVEIDTLGNILDSIDGLQTVDFLKIDAEGLEYEVLAGNNWKKYHPELLCIEANHTEHDWRAILEKEGYKLFFNDGLNEYFADKNSPNLAKFTFAESVLMRYPKIVPFVPHADKLPTTEDMFTVGKGELNKPKASTKEELRWALTMLRDVVNYGITRRIILLKREYLTEKIKKSFKNNTDGLVTSISYATPKMTILRVSLLVFNKALNVVYRLRARGFLR